MTLIIGLRCSDGIVMAADSMSTESAHNGMPITKHITNKIVIQHQLLWGASGSVGVKQIVKEAIEDNYTKIGLTNSNQSAVKLRDELVKLIAPIATNQYKLVYDATLGDRSKLPLTNFVFVRYTNKNKFAIINIECNMAGEVVEAEHISTGSGSKTGQALLGRLRNKKWDLQVGEVVAYRTMNDAIHVEPSGIGPPITMARYTIDAKQNPKIESIEGDDLDRIRDAAEAWTKAEREALTNLTATPVPAPANGLEQIPK